MEYMALVGLLGVLIGSVVTNFFNFVRMTHGTLKIDHSNPEKDVYKIEIEDLDSLDRCKRLYLKVVRNSPK